METEEKPTSAIATATISSNPGHDDGGLYDRITVVITTSPVRSNPDMSILSQVLNSLLLVPGLEGARKLIVCDGYRLGKQCRFKLGRIMPEHEGKYADYKARLHTLVQEGQGPFRNAEVGI